MRVQQVNKLLSAYCTLISSPSQLARCQKAQSLSELLSIIKHYWNQPELSDHDLLATLNQLNQQTIDSNAIQLTGHWLPYRYHAKSKSIYWCLPKGHATEPFQDEYISRCRQQSLLNNIIQPRTALAGLSYQAAKATKVRPAGFIFHLSRCGSTLISGCLSELDTTCVFSESPVLTEILLDPELSTTAQQEHLQQLIDLQACVFPSRPKVIIKWNAWDIFRWDLIREIYFDVPAIFLVRNPVEILASHNRASGRHMAGDLTLANIHSLFANWFNKECLLNKQIDVLEGLLLAMEKNVPNLNLRVIDYQQLDEDQQAAILAFMGGSENQNNYLKIKKRKQFHSKNPEQVFVLDTKEKQHFFTQDEQKMIREKLIPTYNKLLSHANKSFSVVKNAY